MQPVTKLSASPAARLPPAGYFQPARHAADEGRGTAISSSFGTEKSDAVRRGRERPRHAAPAPNRTARERRRARWAPRGHIALPSPAVQQNGPGYRETVTGRATRGPRGSPPPAEPRAHRAPPARHAAPRAVGSPPGARSRGDVRSPRPQNRSTAAPQPGAEDSPERRRARRAARGAPYLCSAPARLRRPARTPSPDCGRPGATPARTRPWRPLCRRPPSSARRGGQRRSARPRFRPAPPPRATHGHAHPPRGHAHPPRGHASLRRRPLIGPARLWPRPTDGGTGSAAPSGGSAVSAPPGGGARPGASHRPPHARSPARSATPRPAVHPQHGVPVLRSAPSAPGMPRTLPPPRLRPPDPVGRFPAFGAAAGRGFLAPAAPFPWQPALSER